MSNDKKDQEFFDYDNYVKKQKNDFVKSKKKSPAKDNKSKQKPPKFVAVNNNSGNNKDEKNGLIDKIKAEEHESIENLKRMFDAALDEDITEIAEIASEEPVPAMPAHNTEAFKKKINYIIGLIVTILAIIGLISVITFSVDKFKAFADNTQQKNDFASFIYPIVICDPAPFDQTTKLRNDTIVTASIWDIILYEDKSKYTTEFDYMVVPEVDIELHAIKLFGTGLNITHASILGTDIQFYYDEDIKSYRIPTNPKYFTYSPVVVDIERVGERYTLTVGYVSPTPAWLTRTGDYTPIPEKYVEYIVSKRGNEYTLVAIQKSDLISDVDHLS